LAQLIQPRSFSANAALASLAVTKLDFAAEVAAVKRKALLRLVHQTHDEIGREPDMLLLPVNKRTDISESTQYFIVRYNDTNLVQDAKGGFVDALNLVVGKHS
jgi:hypothetical protein